MTSSRRPLRIALFVVAAVIVLGIGIGAVAIARFNPNDYKPDIVAAVKRATGRDLALNGKIGLKPSLWPTIQTSDVMFSNPPGFSRPQMASLQRLELQLALLPLLSGRIAIDRLVLIRPDILLETSADGHPNWQMTPEVSPSASPGIQAPVKSSPGTRTEVSVASIRIEEGTLGYRDDRSGKLTTLGLPKLDAKAASPDAPLHLDADAVYNGTPFSLAGDTGALSRLQDPAATSPWPLNLALTVGTAKLSVDGSMTKPLQGKGYTLAINGSVPDTSTLTPLLGGFVPPPLHDVTFAANIADDGGRLPAFSSLKLHVGQSDLATRMPGMMLDHLDIAAAAADQPVKASATGKLGDLPLAFTASTGPLAQLLPGAKPAPFPVDVTVRAADSTASAKGSIADLQAMSGASIALTAQVQDLSALSAIATRPLPAVKQVVFQGTLTDAAGGFRNGARLQQMSLTSVDGDMTGDVAIGIGKPDSLSAHLQSNRIDLDALQGALDQMPAAPPPPPAGEKPSPPRPGRDEHLFSRQPIPFDVLRAADADLTLKIADLHSGGADYKAIDTHAVVKDGKLGIEPFTADLPGGHLSGNLSADAMQTTPPFHVVLHAPGLALKTILAAVHQPSYATGSLEVYADLRGAGDSPHALAASLDGSLGLAMAGGTIDNRLLGSLLGKVMDTLNALDLVGKGGSSELKCFALRIDAQHGIGMVRPLALSSSLLTMTGAGTINLGDETLALALRPQARIAGTGVVIPISVTGPIRDPAVQVNKLGAAESNVGSVAGAVIGDATPLGIVGGLLGGDKLFQGTTDICPPALAAARGQALPEPAKPSSSNPGSLLKSLFR